MPRRIWMLAALAVVVAAGACDGRAREIRAELAPEEREVFDRGAQLSVECWSCHDLYGLEPKIGPGLLGVVGRRAGSVSGFGYSQAMRDANWVWDRRRLFAFLSDGQALVPGNRMIYRGTRDPRALDAMLFYLERVTQPR